MNLKCFRRIEVKKPLVEDRRITAKYEVETDGGKKEFKLIHKYEEDIKTDLTIEFAKLMVAIPVVNYGLFSDEITLSYSIDEKDADFLREAMEITARDIFVNRIVIDTGFIREGYMLKPEEVTPENAKPRAKINFKKVKTNEERKNLKPNYNKCAVMTSGGKESLLTFAVLKEIGADIYPCFFNESGRHWFTALTAYRYFKRKIKETKRVWCNVDRLYNFMLRNMKIIISNFQRIKSDIYPIRLFFFEHFIFSFLPIIYKYRIGNILLGSEYDDPTGLSYELNGIRHYYGVYDQSQEFDKYMTSWFKEKGYNFLQWSAVRPISGLIVERVLSRRYPNFFKLQRSCHSTHVERGKIVPCGTCGKCAGIIIFLLANGVDPEEIGYKRKHINRVINKLDLMVRERKIRLDRSELEHSLYLISQRLKYELPYAVKHGHVEYLHFDPMNSHFDNIPFIFREKIYRVLEGYTKGYAYFSNGEWKEIKREEALKGAPILEGNTYRGSLNEI